MSTNEKRSSMADFQVLQKLGSGSYGSVFKVKRKLDDQMYAIKEVNIRKLQGREREDAVNEIRIMASIKHANICRYCDAFVERDNLYIVMEFAENGDISHQIEKFRKMNKYIKEDTIWSYTIQILQALGAMHNRNVLHRDIKAKNVFLTSKSHVRLGDLGCAKLLKGGLARTQIGTPYYMSPEIWASRPYDAKSDIWAVGCLIYELCQLSPPFTANDMNSLAAKIKTTPATRISKHYSDELATLVDKMLQKNPSMRPSTSDLLNSPSVQSRMHLVPSLNDGEWSGEAMRQNMLATIKLPSGFGYVGFGQRQANGGLNLPAPSFPEVNSAAPSASNNIIESKPTTLNPAPLPTSAPVAAAPVSSAPVAAAPSAPVTSNAQPLLQLNKVNPFAAATSPPQVGKRISALGNDVNVPARNLYPSKGVNNIISSNLAGNLEAPRAAVPSNNIIRSASNNNLINNNANVNANVLQPRVLPQRSSSHSGNAPSNYISNQNNIGSAPTSNDRIAAAAAAYKNRLAAYPSYGINAAKPSISAAPAAAPVLSKPLPGASNLNYNAGVANNGILRRDAIAQPSRPTYPVSSSSASSAQAAAALIAARKPTSVLAAGNANSNYPSNNVLEPRKVGLGALGILPKPSVAPLAKPSSVISANANLISGAARNPSPYGYGAYPAAYGQGAPLRSALASRW